MPEERKFIPQELKKEILDRVKESGLPVAEIARQHGINPKVIYNWVHRGLTGDRSFMEINRLKRENQKLHEIIGKLTVSLERIKKN